MSKAQIIKREDYDADPGERFSNFKYMVESPAHVELARRKSRAVTASMKKGVVGHVAIFEPDRFPLEVAVWDGDRRGKEYTAFCEANAGRTIIKRDEYEKCLGMRDAVRAHPAAAPILAQGEAEVGIWWNDPETGLRLKARIDWLCGSVCDLKTTSDGNLRRFAALSARYKYVHQLAFYRWGVEHALGFADMPCQIIMVESEPPYDVGVFNLNEGDLAYAFDEVRGWLDRLAQCVATNSWPGRYPFETELQMPAWAFDAGDDDDVSGFGLTVNGKEVA